MWCITFEKLSPTSNSGQLQRREGGRDESGWLNDDRNLILGWTILLTYCSHFILAAWFVCFIDVIVWPLFKAKYKLYSGARPELSTGTWKGTSGWI